MILPKKTPYAFWLWKNKKNDLKIKSASLNEMFLQPAKPLVIFSEKLCHFEIMSMYVKY